MPLTPEQTLIWIVGLTAFKDGVPYAAAAKKKTVIQAAKELNLEDFLKNFDGTKFTGFAEMIRDPHAALKSGRNMTMRSS